jgi:four helix bundle protein
MEKENSELFNFEKLLVYQKTLDYIDFVYTLTAKFPKAEVFSLTSQFNRAANSIALNIGEGSGGTKNEFINFIRIAYRSLNECVVCSTLSLRRNYITPQENQELRIKLLEISKMLSGLKNSLSSK